MRNLANYLGFQLVWFVIIMAAARHASVYAIAAAVLFAVVQIYYSPWPQADKKLLGVSFIIGMMLDSLWLNLNWIDYADTHWAWLAPWWIGFSWVSFALTLNHSMRWLSGRYQVLIPACLILPPISYLGGEKLNAIVLIDPVKASIGLAITWVIVLPILIKLAQHWRLQEETSHHAMG